MENNKKRCTACEKLFLECFNCKNIISENNRTYICAINNKHYCDNHCYEIGIDKLVGNTLEKCNHDFDFILKMCKICKIRL